MKKPPPILFVLPNIFTVSSIFCGFYAIVIAVNGAAADRYYGAAVAILFGVLFDAADGRVARMTKTQSDFGVQLDSLADVITFGLAPAVVVYQWALAPYGVIGLVAAFLYVACGSLRLARFNVMAVDPSTSSKFFLGLPIPLAASALMSLVMVHHRNILGGELVSPPLILAMVLILVFAAWAKPAPGESGLWAVIFAVKWYLTTALLITLAVMLKTWFTKEELVNWVEATWCFMKQIFPLLFAGVLVAGFLLGRPGYEALIPERFIAALVGGNSLWANLFASVSGALMYFATLTEVPVLQGLIGSGMGQGPALALLLAGPALSLPSMIALAGIMGVRKTAVYCIIVVVLSTVTGISYGWLVG